MIQNLAITTKYAGPFDIQFRKGTLYIGYLIYTAVQALPKGSGHVTLN